jgi:hypothetical protein
VVHAIVSGALANKPHKGGEAWVRLSWILGLRRLGVDVSFIEQVDREPDQDACRYFDHVVSSFGLGGSAALVATDGQVVAGPSAEELVDLASSVDLLVNISGNLRLDLRRLIRRASYVDLDPGYTQLWHSAGIDLGLAGHDLYVTVGENVGSAGCPIPTDGIPWRPLRPPVVLAEWPAVPATPSEHVRFTTIGSWRGAYGVVETNSHRYGLKAHEFRKVIELPMRSPHPFEIALEIDPADRADLEALEANGWHIVDPALEAGDPHAFRRYVQQSGAEFSVAQGIYVETASGWFSDRTTRYLASGRPALVQDTGFARSLPVGEGLIAFRTLDDAIAGAERIAAAYEDHCRAARAIAEEYFDSDRILTRFLEDVL